MRLALFAVLLATPALSGCLGDVLGLGGTDPEDLLRDDKYTTWIIEIDHVQGHAPSQSAINLLHDRLSEVVNKDRIAIQVDDSIPATDESWSIGDIQRFSKEFKDSKTGGDTVVTHVMYVDGNSDADSDEGRVLGVALSDHETVMIFSESIDESANLRFSATEIERAVLVHELGHILGLVNNGIGMVSPHEDPDSEGHSNNDESVMTAAIETFDIGNFLSGLPTTFDSNDKADLRAAGGKATSSDDGILGLLPDPSA